MGVHVCDTKQDGIDTLSPESRLAMDVFDDDGGQSNQIPGHHTKNVDYTTNIPIRDNNIPSAKQVTLLRVTIHDRQAEFPPACPQLMQESGRSLS